MVEDADLNYFDDNLIKEYAKNAVFQAITNLNAKPAPAGEFQVVLGSGWPGILLHEAIGHGLEGDFNRKKSSAFSNLLGKKKLPVLQLLMMEPYQIGEVL